MYENRIVEVAKGWEGQRMNWVSQSSGKSNLLGALEGNVVREFTPSTDWSLVCFEMPLLASLNVRAMTHWYTKKCIRNPGHYLKGHQLRAYVAGNALPGDLVFWSMKQKANQYLSAFDKITDTSVSSGTPFGLDHVALATGSLHGRHSEVVSFWESNKVEVTDVDAITQSVSAEFGNAEFDVSIARGPWYWGYYLW